MLITSRRNPLVNRLRYLHEAEGRRIHGLILLEGTHLFQEVLRLGLVPTEIIATPKWLKHNNDLTKTFSSVRLVTLDVLRAIATTKNPDGILTVLPIVQLPIAPRTPNFLLVLDRLQDPGNMGTLMRTALAAGVDSLWLRGGVDPLHPKVLRASAGAALSLPLERFSSTVELLQQIKNLSGMQRIATRVQEKYTSQTIKPYWQLDWSKPTALFLGNEGSGLDPFLESICTDGVTIPHSYLVESLNVGVAAAPLLLERFRQRLTYVKNNL
uniref:tRNA/rRNA methyltransferase (SpoU) n=1 Tax=Paulinella micropora TaxID=1928728 RepID=A0A385HZG7_9EUKA|nr:tRNA/rRNA methyltransferase (SpoU) [Paulinella micropora]AXY63051.1 tRNA/rRNA methyltransferase (SpoU) [Paulinella micropora]